MTRSRKPAFLTLMLAVAIGIGSSVVACTPAVDQQPSPSPSLTDGALTVLAASPDGVVAAGQSSSSPWGSALVRVSQSGGTTWTDGLGGLATFTSVAVAPDGAVVAAGPSRVPGSTITLFDASGTVLWTQSCGNSIHDLAFTPDGNVVAVGDTRPTSPVDTDALLLVLSRAGDQLVSRTFGGSYTDSFTTVSVTPDGGIVAAGDTMSGDGDLSGTDKSNTMVVRFSDDGTTQWVETYDLIAANLNGSAVLPDGDVVIAGRVFSGSQNRSSGLLLAVGADGQKAWAKTYTTDDDNRFTDVTVTPTGGLIAVGSARRALPDGSQTDQGLAVGLGAAHGLAWANVSGTIQYDSVAIGGDGVAYVASDYGTIFSLGTGGIPQYVTGSTPRTPADTSPASPSPSSTPSPMWYQHVNSSDLSSFEDVAVLGDGSVAAAGWTRSPAGDFTGNPTPAIRDWPSPRLDFSGLVALYSATGTPLWAKSFPGNNDIQLYGVAATPDGGVVAVGETQSTTGDLRVAKGSKAANGVVVKLDGQGDIVWSTAIPGKYTATFSAVAVAGNGDIYAAGNTTSGGNSSTYTGQSGVIAKLTEDGQVAWAKSYGRSGVGFNAVAVTQDGGVVVTGDTSSSWGDLQSKGMYTDAIVVKVDESGAMAWHQVYDTDGNTQIMDSVAAAKDGTYVAAGRSSVGLFGDPGEFVVRLSQAGDTLSNHTVVQPTMSFSDSAAMTLGADGNPLLIAFASPDDTTGYNYGVGFVIQLGADDQITWTATFQPASTQYFTGIAATPDGNVVLCGRITTMFQGDGLVAMIPIG